MKKFSMLFAFTLIMLFATPSFALLGSYDGVQTVPPPAQPGNGAVYTYNPASGARQSAPLTATSVRKAVAKGFESLAGKNGALTKIDAKASEAAAEAKKAADAVAKQGGKLETIDRNIDGARSDIRNLDDKLTGKNGALAATTAAVNDVDHTLLWVTFGLAALMIILAFVGWLVTRGRHQDHESQLSGLRFDARETRDGVANVQHAADTILAEVRGGFAEMRSSFTELPQKVADVMNTLDPSPFEFEVAGHMVSYQPPLEGINAGYYLTLHVPQNQTGDAASYERQHETNRGVAIRSCRKTMRLYFEGAFDAAEFKVQKELIILLSASGDIKVRKIS